MHFILILPLEIFYEQSLRTRVINLKGLRLVISSLFTLIIIFNLSGIIPYVFRITGHLLFTLVVGLPL